MIVLDTTTRKLQVLMDATATTTESPIVSSYDDITTTTFTPGANQSITTGTTAIDLVAAPGASTQRAVKYLSCVNADTVARIVTFRFNDNGTTRNILIVQLQVGDSITYANGQWTYVPKLAVGSIATLIQYGTHASRPAVATSNTGYMYFETDTLTMFRSDGAAWDDVGFVDPGICEGRLTLTTLVPITSADVTGATTMYFTPYKGSRISIYNGTIWKMYKFSEVSLALGTLGSATIPNDVFIYDNAGTLTLEFLAWTSTTARATALVLQDGVLIKSGGGSNNTRRFLGTFTPTATTTTEDSVLNRHVSNYYNAVPRSLQVTDSTASWNPAGTSFAQRGSKQVNFTNCGGGSDGTKLEKLIRLDGLVACQNSALNSGSIGIGLDSSTTNSATIFYGAGQQVAGTGTGVAIASYHGYPGIGSRNLLWLERDSSGTTETFFGSSASVTQGGFIGWIDN